MPAIRTFTKNVLGIEEIHIRHGVHSNFVSIIPKLLHVLIVGIRMRYIERAANGASIGIASVRRKQHLGEKLPVVVIDGVVKGQQNHLWYIVCHEITRDLSAILGAEAMGQLTFAWITYSGCIRIVLYITPTLIGSIGTIDRTITKVFLRQAGAIGTAQMIRIRTIGHLKQGLWCRRLRTDIAIVDVRFEITNLTHHIEQ